MTDRPKDYRGLYPADLADVLKKRTGQKYQPSNGTESKIFQYWFCNRCKHDASYRADPESGNGCRILADTLAYDVTNSAYPAEWQYDSDGQPICTAFEEET